MKIPRLRWVVGSLLVFASAWFIRRGWQPRTARRIVLFWCAVLVPPGALVPFMGGNAGVFAHSPWLTGITTSIVDLIPRDIPGTAFGFIAAGSAPGGIGMSQTVPWVIGHYSYSPCFYAMVAVHPLAFLLIWLFARRDWPTTLPA